MNLPVLASGASVDGRSPEGLATPAEVVSWALRRFRDRRLLATTAFGIEGCMLVHLLADAGARIDVLTIDTDFLHAETIALRERMRQRYPHLRFVEIRTSMGPEQQAALHGDRLWERDPDLCCTIRKVRPLRAAMRGADAWLTGIRRGQGGGRSQTRLVEWDWQHELVKVNPLACLTRSDVWQYVRRHEIPFNPMHEQGYPSIGCTHCTRAVPGAGPVDETREGRWSGHGKTECGLHAGRSDDGPARSV